MSKPLILAPLGKINQFDALINSGADMVYTGYSSFSRGGSLYGLNDNEIRQLLKKAVFSEKKVIAALNIIPESKNIEFFFGTVDKLIVLGIRDFIFNDAGLISLAKKKFPEIKITASVGCGIVNIEDVLFFEEISADTVVLNPVVTPLEVAEIRKKTKIKLELFIFFEKEFILKSKCLLTGYIRDGSSKKGISCGKICAFNWIETDKNFDNTFKDLKPLKISKVELIKDFIQSGVDIFKIEGRNLPEKVVLDIVELVRKRLME